MTWCVCGRRRGIYEHGVVDEQSIPSVGQGLSGLARSWGHYSGGVRVEDEGVAMGDGGTVGTMSGPVSVEEARVWVARCRATLIGATLSAKLRSSREKEEEKQ